MRVGLDATPLLGVRTGVGRYVEHLFEALADDAAEHGDELVATAFTLRGRGGLPTAVPGLVSIRARPAPARVLHAAWARAEVPPVEWLTGRLDVFHATNFVLPPLRRAVGVVTVHDLSYLRTPDTVSPASLRYRTLVPRSIGRAAVVCTPSAAVAAEVREEYRLEPDRVVVTPLGVDASWFDTAAPPPSWLAGRELPGRYLLFVGTREPRKGLTTLLTGYAGLRSAAPDTPPLVLVGPPGWGPALDTAGLPSDAVHTIGYLPGDELRQLVAGAACLVFPSRYEGFGLPPLEAFACGTPVVASDLAVTREVTGRHARLVPVGDADALADALTATLADGGPTGAAERREHARGFTWTRCAETTRVAYRRALTTVGS
ncbi:MAG TPA: glycosyltransferase family 1 protein [Mycobacteriales bacterium]